MLNNIADASIRQEFCICVVRNMQALYGLRVTTLARLVTIFSQARKASGVNTDDPKLSVYLLF
jgi:hypothetical protein